jgi:hypothetical protein
MSSFPPCILVPAPRFGSIFNAKQFALGISFKSIVYTITILILLADIHGGGLPVVVFCVKSGVGGIPAAECGRQLPRLPMPVLMMDNLYKPKYTQWTLRFYALQSSPARFYLNSILKPAAAVPSG